MHPARQSEINDALEQYILEMQQIHDKRVELSHQEIECYRQIRNILEVELPTPFRGKWPETMHT